jgi:hypothetical protein
LFKNLGIPGAIGRDGIPGLRGDKGKKLKLKF